MNSSKFCTEAKSELREVSANEMAGVDGGTGMYIGRHGIAINILDFGFAVTTSGWALFVPGNCVGGSWGS